MIAKKIRLDKLLVDRGDVPTLERARALILAREVLQTAFCREKLTNDTLIKTFTH